MLDEPPTRRFMLGDAMIVVVGTAALLGILKANDYDRLFVDPWPVLADRINRGMLLFTVAAPATVAVLGLRLRNPRPTRRNLFDQPGAVACIAACVAIVVSILIWVGQSLLDLALPGLNLGPPMGPFAHALLAVADDSTRMAGFGVLLSWCLLLISGRWRADRSWIDRLGRLIGLAWLVVWGDMIL